MNPIIYACSSKEFKRAFRRILKCQFKRQPRLFLNDQGFTSTSLVELNKTSSKSMMIGSLYRHRVFRADERRHSDMTMSERVSYMKNTQDSSIMPLMMFQKRQSKMQMLNNRKNTLIYEKSSCEDILSDDERSETSDTTPVTNNIDVTSKTINKCDPCDELEQVRNTDVCIPSNAKLNNIHGRNTSTPLILLNNDNVDGTCNHSIDECYEETVVAREIGITKC